MGGSGGSGGYRSTSIEDIKRLVGKSQSNTQKEAFRTELNEYLLSLLKEFNSRDAELINERISNIKEIIKEILEDELPISFGGSVSKHTYVDGLSDVDSLMIINNTDLSSKNPSDVLNFIVAELSTAGLNAKKGDLAVTITYSDGMEIQVLPAIKSNDKIKIPDARNDCWSDLINPKGFTEKLTEINKACNNKVVPTIKLAKAINSAFPEKLQLSGYHIESLAIEAFRGYQETFTHSEMLMHFFKTSSANVKSLIKDHTGQSRHVDEYLGVNDSQERKNISHLLNRTYIKMQNAMMSSCLDDWQGLFED